MVSDEQLQQVSAWIKRLEELPESECQAALRQMRAQNLVDRDVLRLVVVHFLLPPEPDRCRTGEQVGNYTLGEPLGSGAMGIVYRATQYLLGEPIRDVAVKLLHPTFILTGQSDALERFKDEMVLLAQFEHAGMARIYDGGLHTDATGETMPFMVMQLVRGGLPITAYADKQELPISVRLELFLDVCEAVKAMHQHQPPVIHRDLKPTNILVDNDGRPFVLDFGLAQVCDPSRRRGGGEFVSGTPAYMSPEQVSNPLGAIDPKSDVYTLGVILYELLTGRRPYAIPLDASWTALRQAILHAVPAPLSQYNVECRGTLDTIVAKTLEKDPAKRFPSMEELQRELRGYLEMRRQVEIEEMRRQAKTEQWTAPKRKLWGGRQKVGALLLLVASCLGGIFGWRWVTPSASLLRGVTVSPDGTELYVADEQRSEVLVLDRATLDTRVRVGIGQSGSPGTPQRIVPTPNGSQLYVTNPQAGTVIVIDRDTYQVRTTITTGKLPRWITITPDGKKAYVSNEGPIPQGSISVIDTATYQVVKSITGVLCPEGSAITRNGQRLYVASQCGAGQDPVFVIDTATDEIIATIPGLAVGMTLAVTPDGRKVYVARGNYTWTDTNTGRIGSPLSVIDMTTRTITHNFPLETSVTSVTMTRDGKYLLVGNGNKISMIDTTADQVVNELKLHTPPFDIALADDDSVYVTLPEENRVFLFGLSGLLPQPS